ncbi:MAG: cupin domain-containing protein [Pseudomonadota bacterium]
MFKDPTYDAFMLDHASRSLSPGLNVLADAHLALNEAGRDRSDIWAAIGGVLLENVDGSPHASRFQRQAMPYRTDETSASILDANLDDLPWKTGFSGVEYARGRTPHTKFMRLDAGKSAPKHRHSALEATLVLKGTLSDGEHTYEVGEIAFGVPGEVHKPMAVGNETCVCFVAQDRKPFWRLS